MNGCRLLVKQSTAFTKHVKRRREEVDRDKVNEKRGITKQIWEGGLGNVLSDQSPTLAKHTREWKRFSLPRNVTKGKTTGKKVGIYRHGLP